MKIEYDLVRDLLYVYFASPEKRVAKTITIVPGVHADLSAEGKLIGLELLDASEALGGRVQFEVMLTSTQGQNAQ